jgi:hypothetical protein
VTSRAGKALPVPVTATPRNVEKLVMRAR